MVCKWTSIDMLRSATTCHKGLAIDTTEESVPVNSKSKLESCGKCDPRWSAVASTVRTTVRISFVISTCVVIIFCTGMFLPTFATRNSWHTVRHACRRSRQKLYFARSSQVLWHWRIKISPRARTYRISKSFSDGRTVHERNRGILRIRSCVDPM